MPTNPPHVSCLCHAASLARGSYPLIWNEDDLFFPWRISQTVHLSGHGLDQPDRLKPHLMPAGGVNP